MVTFVLQPFYFYFTCSNICTAGRMLPSAMWPVNIFNSNYPIHGQRTRTTTMHACAQTEIRSSLLIHMCTFRNLQQISIHVALTYWRIVFVFVETQLRVIICCVRVVSEFHKNPSKLSEEASVAIKGRELAYWPVLRLHIDQHIIRQKLVHEFAAIMKL